MKSPYSTSLVRRTGKRMSCFFFSSRRRHTRWPRDWSSDVCSSDLAQQLELCQAAAEKTGRRTGDVLVEMGLLKETEKLYYVAQQVKAIVYSVFGWADGEYRLHFTDRAAKEAIKIDLHPANLIARGVKKLYKPERLFRLLSPEDRLSPSRSE